VVLHTTPEERPAIPAWFAECTLIVAHLQQRGVLDTLSTQVRLSRGRAGTYEALDMVLLLLAYALSGEPSLHAFYDRLAPCHDALAALLHRQRLPHRATLSRFLHAVDPAFLTALRQVLAADLHAHGLRGDALGGLQDPQGQRWLVFDVDGTRHAARQRAVPMSADLPPPRRRLSALCAPGYTGRQRGEVVRTRTTVNQAHTQEWLGTFAGPGNGDYRTELDAALTAVTDYLDARDVPHAQGLLRLDGLYGSLSLLARIQTTGVGFVVRGKTYTLLAHPQVQARLQQPPTTRVRRMEAASPVELFDVGELSAWQAPLPDLPLRARLIVMRHAVPPPPTRVTVGKVQDGWVYELFLTTVPATAMSAATIIALYHHRGAFEQVLADEDQEQATERWCSLHPAGQECWQLINQWAWNLRLELGHRQQPIPVRWTYWDETHPLPVDSAQPAADNADDPPAPQPAADNADDPPAPQPTAGPVLELSTGPNVRGRYTGRDFTIDADGRPRCPAGVLLRAQHRTPLPSGDVRICFAAPSPSCRACAQRAQCIPPNGQRGRRIIGYERQQPVASAAADTPAAPDAEPAAVAQAYEPLTLAGGPRIQGRYTGQDFTVGEHDTIVCPAGQTLYMCERQTQPNGDVRVRFAASSVACQRCTQRAQCVPLDASRPRRVTGIYRVAQPPASAPAPIPAAGSPEPAMAADDAPAAAVVPLWWCDAGGRQVRRALMAQLRRQQVTLTVLPAPEPVAPPEPGTASQASVLSRAERAHRRLSWAERLQRNARSADAPRYHIVVPGVDAQIAVALEQATGP
jgi:hypothetical protein